MKIKKVFWGLICKIYGHDWWVSKFNEWGLEHEQKCSRCGEYRHMVVDVEKWKVVWHPGKQSEQAAF